MDESTKYREIAADLQNKIESGELPPGEKLPSDAELGEIYDVSRNTIREAIKLLVTRRLVEKQGTRGTFVLRTIDPFSTVVSVATGFGGFEGVANASRGTSVTTPRVEIREAPADIAADLQLSEPFSSCVCLADLQCVDCLGELAGAPGAATELAEDAPGLELGVRALAG